MTNKQPATPMKKTRATEQQASACSDIRQAEPARPDGNTSPPDSCPSLDSEALLRGHNCVAINHRGSVYRLQATRQGKLILTK